MICHCEEQSDEAIPKTMMIFKHTNNFDKLFLFVSKFYPVNPAKKNIKEFRRDNRINRIKKIFKHKEHEETRRTQRDLGFGKNKSEPVS